LASGSAAVQTLTGNSGGAISPTAGNINTVGTGSITVVGSGSTLTTQLTGLTNHAVQVGAGTATLTQVGPFATAGIPLISEGSTTDPAFGTAVVAGGGTGNTTFTAYSVICAGTTATGAFQNVSGVGTSGQVLTSNGAAALPSWASPASTLVLIQSQKASSSTSLAFTSIGSYNYYLLSWYSVVPASSAVTLQLQTSNNNGSTYANTGYSSGINFTSYNSTSITNSNITTAFLLSGSAGTNSNGMSGYCYLSNFNNGVQAAIAGQSNWLNPSSSVQFGSMGGVNGASGTNAFQVFFSSGNISSGVFTLWGIRNI